MKNKLFLSLSILTSAFAVQAETEKDFGAVLGEKIAAVVNEQLNSVVSEDQIIAPSSSEVIERYNQEVATADAINKKKLTYFGRSQLMLAHALQVSKANISTGYKTSKDFVVANPKKSAGIAAGSAALVAATVYLYKKGYLKSPFAQAAKKTEVKSVETKKATPAATPVVKAPAKKAKKQVAKPVVKKESRTRRAINKVKAKFARKK